jgi:hypothetical protein
MVQLPFSNRLISSLKALILSINLVGGPGSSAGIATDYGLEGPGIELQMKGYTA